MALYTLSYNFAQAVVRLHRLAVFASITAVLIWTSAAESQAAPPTSSLSWNQSGAISLTYPLEVRLAHPETQPGLADDIRYAITATNKLLGIIGITYSPVITNRLSLLRSEKTIILVAHDHLLRSVDPQEAVTQLTLLSTINGLIGKGLWGTTDYNEGSKITVHGSRSSFDPTLPAQCSVAFYSVNRTIGHIRLLIAGHLNRIQLRRCLFQMLTFSAGINLFSAEFNETKLVTELARADITSNIDLDGAFSPLSLEAIRRIATAYSTK